MAKPYLRLALVPAACLSLTLGCSASSPTTDGAAGSPSGSSGSSSQSGGATGSAGTMTVGASGSTAIGQGGAGNAGAGGATAAGGMSAAAGSSASAGTGGVSTPPGGVRTGMSAGCNKPPPSVDSTSKFINHEVHITGLDPVYLTGGMYADTSGPYDLSFRPYGVRLPANYDPSKPYAVTVGGGGCGGNAQNFAGNPGGGLTIDKTNSTLQVGLSYITGCFNDGGPSIGNRTDSPEDPYFRAVMADLEANYCIDLSKVFMAGYSSGGWEAYTLGCADSDLIRGIGADEGGLRTMHPACKGPVAAVLVAGAADTENPVGPLDPNNATDKGAIDRLGSLGSAPGRDNILMRNGCSGTTTAPYDPAYPECVKYTGCPAAYPVIWCELPGVGHNNSTYNNINYSPGPMWAVLGALPPP